MFTLAKSIEIAFFLLSHFFRFTQSFRIFRGNICSAVREANAAYTKNIHGIFIEQIWSKNLKVSVLAEIWRLD